MQWRINLQDRRYCMTSTHTQAKQDISVTRTKKLALKVDYTLRANTSPLRVKAAQSLPEQIYRTIVEIYKSGCSTKNEPL